MTTFIILATIIFALLTMIWTRKNWTNLFIKVVFGSMTVYGMFLILVESGYIVKV